MPELGIRVALALVCLPLACCERHIQLQFPNSTQGAEYTCHPTDGQSVHCEPATLIDPAANNRANTVFITLPPECKQQFYQITIHDAGSSKPVADVKCAPLENHIE